MNPSLFVRVKICCISSIEEAQLAIKYGASALGLVSEMPSGPGVIDEGLIAEIVKTIPPPIAAVLLTSKTHADQIIKQQRTTKANTIQLVDFVDYNDLRILREELTGVKLIQVIHVIDESSVTEAKNVEQFVDAILLDSGNPNLDVKILGGTGKSHNWKISKKIREQINLPMFLAGGLNPGNVLSAIDNVNPFGLDVCSGVRTDGKLDEKKLKSLFNEINKFN